MDWCCELTSRKSEPTLFSDQVDVIGSENVTACQHMKDMQEKSSKEALELKQALKALLLKVHTRDLPGC